MKKFIYIFLAFTIAGLQSCDDYVDIQPRGNAIVQTLEDVDLLLNNASVLGRTSEIIPLLINDNIQATPAQIAAIENGRDFYRYYARIYNMGDEFYLPSEDDREWNGHYNVIGTMNYILSEIDAIGNDDDKRNHYKGEALVHRAYHYFQLVNTYAQHYGTSIAGEPGSGVPIVTTFGDATVSIERSSVNEVYDFVLNDLNEALSLLNTASSGVDRPNLGSANALLARIYLHMGDYSNALNYADVALGYNDHLLDYNTDMVQASPWSPAAPPFEVEDPEYVMFKFASVPQVSMWPNPNVLLSTLSDEVTALSDPFLDFRLSTLAPQDWASGKHVYGFNDPYGYAHSTGINTPELYLIKAECLARSGQADQAMDLVNGLRAKRFVADYVAAGGHLLTASNGAEAVQHVIDERRREFHVNGKRFFTIKRLNAIENAGISYTRGAVTFSANGANWAVPIAPAVINTSNGQIVQNPRE